MNCNTPEDVARLIALRDNISENEALNLIDQCIEELLDAQNIFEMEDTLKDWLGLEPDYLEILLP